jgi:hypothetical protein
MEILISYLLGRIRLNLSDTNVMPSMGIEAYLSADIGEYSP